MAPQGLFQPNQTTVPVNPKKKNMQLIIDLQKTKEMPKKTCSFLALKNMRGLRLCKRYFGIIRLDKLKLDASSLNQQPTRRACVAPPWSSLGFLGFQVAREPLRMFGGVGWTAVRKNKAGMHILVCMWVFPKIGVENPPKSSICS